ncbi:hypothetical protein [Parasulfitobacter algicola]|uniref:Uncharacterized protein n=1 Tax=Parasulfitobacter algicola TaxID=2614809 RepID=A0ABX2IM19_9RHOB|nr:hypothetical protein [Sulfitobacter algicola]NSX53914.1 hypothetical protein [Sulfitobacter algicola]
MQQNKKDDADLDVFFEAARATPYVPPVPLVDRILNDAASQNAPFWHKIWSELGGWPVTVGLATACSIGIVIGLTSPMLVSDIYMSEADIWASDNLLLDVSVFMDEG